MPIINQQIPRNTKKTKKHLEKPRTPVEKPRQMQLICLPLSSHLSSDARVCQTTRNTVHGATNTVYRTTNTDAGVGIGLKGDTKCY